MHYKIIQIQRNKVLNLDELPDFQQQVAGLSARDRIELLTLAYGLIDLTNLSETSTTSQIIGLCEQAKVKLPDGQKVAAVCFYPATRFIEVAKEILRGEIPIAVVGGGFPDGQNNLEGRLKVNELSLKAGADEIDEVISRGLFFEGRFSELTEEISAFKAQIGPKRTLKIILETGQLGSSENILRASQLAIEGGADFIKTSTGKISHGAKLEDTAPMLLAIKDHHDKTQAQVGIKPSGGINNDLALALILQVKHMLGDTWLTPRLFRLGSSSLALGIIKELRNTDWDSFHLGIHE